MTLAHVTEYREGVEAAYAKEAAERVNPAYDEALATREIAASKAEHAQRLQSADELAALLLPLVMQARHRVVFDWMCQSNGVTPAQAITQIIRAEVARQTPDWREAQGGGGTSSKNLEVLAERIPVRK